MWTTLLYYFLGYKRNWLGLRQRIVLYFFSRFSCLTFLVLYFNPYILFSSYLRYQVSSNVRELKIGLFLVSSLESQIFSFIFYSFAKCYINNEKLVILYLKIHVTYLFNEIGVFMVIIAITLLIIVYGQNMKEIIKNKIPH